MTLARLSLFAALAVPALAAAAETGYYLVTTYPVEGEKSIDFKYWNAKPDGAPPRSAPELGFGMTVTPVWYTEVSAEWFKLSPGPHRFSAWEWQNDFMLTHGQYDVDVALHTQVARSHRDGAIETEFGPVLQTEIGKTQLNFNAFLQREFHVDDGEGYELVYEWQVRHHWTRAFQFGVQGFGEVGKWNDWLPRDQQSHRAGPAVFGTLDVGRKQEIRYDAAYLIGKNAARNAKSVTLRVQYVFR
jgi:hypothetical protein